MPLHPVPIIIGTTLAVIGGGYAFKKFVYDPHLAPYIEAFIAAHTTSNYNESRRPIPVAVENTGPAYARSTARRDRGVELRRRRTSNDRDETESRQPLLSPAHGDPEAAGRVDTYEPYMLAPPSCSQSQVPLRRFSRDRPTYLDLHSHPERSSSPQDAEIREVIFNQPPTPVRPQSTPVAMSANVFHPRGAAIPDIMTSPSRASHHMLQPSLLEAPSPRNQPESTAFSFLSLSQASSPEAPHAMLRHMAASSNLDDAVDQWAAVPRSAERRASLRLEREAQFTNDDASAIDQWADVHSAAAREEDVMSLPETSTSGYEDAESYTPDVQRSPTKIHTTFLHASPARSTGGLGLVSGRAAHAGPAHLPRARDSVISLSESEGWAGMSDFEGGHL